MQRWAGQGREGEEWDGDGKRREQQQKCHQYPVPLPGFDSLTQIHSDLSQLSGAGPSKPSGPARAYPGEGNKYFLSRRSQLGPETPLQDTTCAHWHGCIITQAFM